MRDGRLRGTLGSAALCILDEHPHPASHPLAEEPCPAQVSRRHGIRSLACRQLSARQKLACALLLWWREVLVYFAFQVECKQYDSPARSQSEPTRFRIRCDQRTVFWISLRIMRLAFRPSQLLLYYSLLHSDARRASLSRLGTGLIC